MEARREEVLHVRIRKAADCAEPFHGSREAFLGLAFSDALFDPRDVPEFFVLARDEALVRSDGIRWLLRAFRGREAVEVKEVHRRVRYHPLSVSEAIFCELNIFPNAFAGYDVPHAFDIGGLVFRRFGIRRGFRPATAYLECGAGRQSSDCDVEEVAAGEVARRI